ncbi:MAG: hypothetical protein H0V37_11095 [Chloroflexia bacterium]|nr:hypothetical protein [Chloroflexia bacterium]
MAKETPAVRDERPNVPGMLVKRELTDRKRKSGTGVYAWPKADNQAPPEVTGSNGITNGRTARIGVRESDMTHAPAGDDRERRSAYGACAVCATACEEKAKLKEPGGMMPPGSNRSCVVPASYAADVAIGVPAGGARPSMGMMLMRVASIIPRRNCKRGLWWARQSCSK